MISACHRQLPRSPPAMVTSPRATAATMSCSAGSSTHHSPSSGMTRGAWPVSLFTRKFAPVAGALVAGLGKLGAAGLTGTRFPPCTARVAHSAGAAAREYGPS